MITPQAEILIKQAAAKYENADFISSDPISFPHRYTSKKDIETAAFIAAWVAYGKRELFLKVLDMIGSQMQSSPYGFIMQERFAVYKGDDNCLYRFFKRNDFYNLCLRLKDVYSSFEDMEAAVNKNDAVQSLTEIFCGINGIPKDTKSACKRLCMFLRWMVRGNSPVDFGLWQSFSASELIIPLDVHVFRQSKALGLTDRNDTSMKTALQITNNLKQIFPSDPLKADFALFSLDL